MLFCGNFIIIIILAYLIIVNRQINQRITDAIVRLDKINKIVYNGYKMAACR
nr:MAG TPA: hypothetical protein [Caudoviricetes sp.]